MSVSYTTKFEETNLAVYRGDTETYTFQCYDDDALTVQSNLTGYTISAQCRLHPDENNTYFDTGATAGMAIANGTNGSVFATGTVVLLITAAITNVLPDVTYYDIRAMSGSVVRRIASGKLIVRKSVTR